MCIEKIVTAKEYVVERRNVTGNQACPLLDRCFKFGGKSISHHKIAICQQKLL
jgi:hypothetical protein